MSSYDIEFVHISPSKNAVLMFHSLTGTPYELQKYAKVLFEEGYDVYSYTLAGHIGHKINIYEVKYEDWIEDAIIKYNNLKGRYENLFVSGIGLGALIALYLAASYTSLSGVVSISAPIFLDNSLISKHNFLLQIAMNTILKYYCSLLKIEPYSVKNGLLRRQARKNYKLEAATIDNCPLCALLELLKFIKYIKNILGEIKAPILIIQSIEDNFITLKSLESIESFLQL